MIGTKHKIGFGQYLPLKPTKWGIKVWVMADAVTGYCCNLQIYTGREGNHAEKGLANRVVIDVIIDYQGLGHRINVDFILLLSYSRISKCTEVWLVVQWEVLERVCPQH